MGVCPTCGARFGGQERFCPIDGTRLVDETALNQATDDEAPEALIGTIVAERYRVERVLGVGGMGVVYLATHEALGRQVAIKLLRRSLSQELGSTRRFLVEARAASQLDHENIISIHDFGRDARGRYFIVMEYAGGEPLSDVVNREAPFQQERAIVVLRQILSALSAAHRENIVHRDLKPENIICTARRDQQDFVKILDFGLAKILGDDVIGGPVTSPGIVMGTPEFMSPEQSRGEAVDGRSDLYSAGIVAYEMLTGQVPFSGTYIQVMWDHCETTPPPPSKARAGLDIDPDLELLVLTLLGKTPEERFQNAGAALSVLTLVDNGLAGSEGKSQSVIERTRAELKKSSIIKLPTGRSDQPLSQTVKDPQDKREGSPPPTGPQETAPVDSVWHRSALLQELGRLTTVRGRRIREVAALLWGSGPTPAEAELHTEAIEIAEALVADKEAEVAMLRERVVDHEKRGRLREADLRKRRVDLVASAAAVGQALARAEGAEVTADMPAADDDAVFASSDSLHVPQGASPRELRAEQRRLDAAIGEVDRDAMGLGAEIEREVAAYERAIQIKLADVERTKAELAAAFAGLEAYVREAAAGRSDVAEHFEALDELAEAVDALVQTLDRQPS